MVYRETCSGVALTGNADSVDSLQSRLLASTRVRDREVALDLPGEAVPISAYGLVSRRMHRGRSLLADKRYILDK